jgi:hypothetical protein
MSLGFLSTDPLLPKAFAAVPEARSKMTPGLRMGSRLAPADLGPHEGTSAVFDGQLAG